MLVELPDDPEWWAQLALIMWLFGGTFAFLGIAVHQMPPVASGALVIIGGSIANIMSNLLK